jgi:hypothetical protein
MATQQYLQSVSVGYPDQSLTVPYAAPSQQQLYVHSASAYNGTAAENRVGLFHTTSDSQFKLTQILSGGNASATASIQSGVTISVLTTTNNDGCLFQSKEKFHLIAFNIIQAQTGSPVFTFKYYNGSSYVPLTLLNTPDFSQTGIQVILFNAPVDWVSGNGGVSASDNTMFSIQVLATTASSQLVTINSLKIGKMIEHNAHVPQGASLKINFEDEPYLLQAGESIIPFFSYTSASNRIEIAYKTM